VEGLILAHALQSVAAMLPARTLGWVFPDETTAAVLIEGTGNLVLSYRPPSPAVFVTQERLAGEPRNPFQRMLANRVRGVLTDARQLKLDRVMLLHFSGEQGFVDTPAVRLVIELTGRNANLILLEDGEGWEGTILAAARDVTNARNRYRVVKAGRRYVPPPPYEKLDPRALTDEQAADLATVPLAKWRDRIDGIGLLLTAELSRRSGIPLREAPRERLVAAVEALQSIVRDPHVAADDASGNVRDVIEAEKAEALRKSLREPLLKRRTLLRNQLADVERAAEGYDTAQTERGDADLLLAYAHLVPPGASEVELPSFTGDGTRRVEIDPQLTAVQHAEKLYARARRREDVFDRLAEREPRIQAELQEVERQLDQLDEATLAELQVLERDMRESRPERSPYGARYRTPSGFEVLVGRNNKENDILTHRLGRSTDYWLHAQGYPGSHVLVRTSGKDLPLPDLLVAAAIAAYHSKARGSSNVSVDYTRVKHVWRPRGAPAGKVHYTQQKTVYVTPALPTGEARTEDDRR